MSDIKNPGNYSSSFMTGSANDKASYLSFNKASPMPRPDFSSIEQKEANFTYKQKGSYKKPKSIVPESPMKSPTQKYFTPVKAQSNLFGNMSTCRKLNFLTDNNKDD